MEKYEKKDYKKRGEPKKSVPPKRYGFPNQKHYKNKTLLNPQHLPSLRPKSATNLIINQTLW